MWRLIRLEAEGFRGINKRIILDPHPQLTIIFGENGSGKTSLAEAIEWVIRDTTQKLEDAPIVLQDGSRSFIDSPPAKRWDRIATMLDLEPLKNFQDFVGRTVMIARHRFSTLLSALDRLAGEASSRGLNDLAAAIRKTELGARRSGDVRSCSSCSWRNGPTGWVVRAPHFEAS